MRSKSRRGPTPSLVPETHSLTTLYRGSESVLYQGKRASDDASVVVKLLGRRAGAGRQDESGLWDALSLSPGVQPLLMSGTTDEGRPYLLMEYSSDGSYEDVLGRGDPLPVDEVVRVGATVAEALGAVHALDQLHHAVTPANILRTESGPALIDFGSALPLDHPFPPVYYSRTTLLHAPPEALRGELPSPASDVYRLASTLWTLLAGHAPFDDADGSVGLEEYRERLLTAPVPDLPREDVPDWLTAVLRWAMAKDPDQRARSAEEFAEALRLERAPAGFEPDGEPVTEPEPVAESAVESEPVGPAEDEVQEDLNGDTAWWADPEPDDEPDGDAAWWADPEPEDEPAGDTAWWADPDATDEVAASPAVTADHTEAGGIDTAPVTSTPSHDGVPAGAEEEDSESPWWEDFDPDPAPTSASAPTEPGPAPTEATPAAPGPVPERPSFAPAARAAATEEAPTEQEADDWPPGRPQERSTAAVRSGPAAPAVPPPSPSFGGPEPFVRQDRSAPRSAPAPSPVPRAADAIPDGRPPFGDDGGAAWGERRNKPMNVVLVVALAVLVVATLGAGVYVLVGSLSSPQSPEQDPGVAQGEDDPNGAAEDPVPAPAAEADIAPTEVGVSDESVSVSLSWTDNSGGDTPHYVVGGPVGSTPTTMANVESGVATVEMNGLNPEVEYCFRVVAVQSADVLAPSGEVCTDRG